MTEEGLLDYGLRLGESAGRRFVHWDAGLWDDFLTGPLQALAEALAGSALSHDDAVAVARTYLDLACEAVGLGYVYPASAGRRNVFSLLWRELIPRDLASIPAEQRAALLAACWNVGENTESSPVWLQRVVLRECEGLSHLRELEAMIGKVSRRLDDVPATPLGSSPRAFWVFLPREDPRFLPGWAHFVAPTVACVHDRLRTSAEAGRDVTCGVLIDGTPAILGPLGCDIRAAGQTMAPAPLSRFSLQDPRITPAYHLAANEWRAAASLVSSQYLLVLCP